MGKYVLLINEQQIAIDIGDDEIEMIRLTKDGKVIFEK